jgi:adenine-specific DNA-methyltransferase
MSKLGYTGKHSFYRCIFMVLAIPSPYFNERPTAYADRVGAWYLAWNKSKKEMGQYFTPIRVADYMAQLVIPSKDTVRVLDPGAGVGILSCALCERLDGNVDLEAYETDLDLADCLETCLRYTQEWMKARGRNLQFKIIRGDFVMARAWALQWPTNDTFDVVISNPPYFKLSKTDPRAKAAAAIVHGQPNIYAIFMALGAALLNADGQLVLHHAATPLVNTSADSVSISFSRCAPGRSICSIRAATCSATCCRSLLSFTRSDPIKIVM